MRLSRFGVVWVLLVAIILVGCIGGTRYTLTLLVQPGEAGITAGTRSYAPGTRVLVQAVAKEGFIFRDWTKNGVIVSQEASFVFRMPREEVSLVANFLENGFTRPGDASSHWVDGVLFFLRLVPAARFPTGIEGGYSWEPPPSDATVFNPFWLAESETTYDLWYPVKQWALTHGYTFANEGQEGSEGTIGASIVNGGQPVTNVNWRDCIVWCNALSEKLGYDPVYTYHGVVIRDSTNEVACDNAVQEDRNGFRLPTKEEWELAAKWKGKTYSSGDKEYPLGSLQFWSPGNYASGASSSVSDATKTGLVAWYGENSGNATNHVKTKQPNLLSLYDMSGNVSEWCFDAHESDPLLSRIQRGGGWRDLPSGLQTGDYRNLVPEAFGSDLGFRLARNAAYYTLTVHVEGEGTVGLFPKPEEGRYIDGSQVNLIATPMEYYRFSHWKGAIKQGEDDKNPAQHILMDDNKTITAVFDKVRRSFFAEGVSFHFRKVPQGTFLVGTHDRDTATVFEDFWMAETELSYELWYTVKQYAKSNGYIFANAGREGSHGATGEAPSSSKTEPVTMISWRDAIVWCNALSAMQQLTPVYRYQGEIIKDATNATACDYAVQENTSGFRLPTKDEWELAARWQGRYTHTPTGIEHPKGSGYYWTPGDYASGILENSYEESLAVAWYRSNSSETKGVGEKRANQLGLRDMSGNVWELCFDRYPGETMKDKVLRGASFTSVWPQLGVGRIYSLDSYEVKKDVGFRLVKTAD